MDTLKNIINKNKNNYPGLKEYIVMINGSEDNVKAKPDISIEYSKAVFEGVSKYIITKTDHSPSKKLENLSTREHIIEVSKALDKRNKNTDIQTFSDVFESFACLLSSTRNTKGEVCHGKYYPKFNTSSIQTAEMTLQITDAIVHYILYLFLELPEKERKEEDKYENYIEFNKQLDAKNQLPNNISYSKALYEQDPTAYSEGYDDYIENQ